MKRILSAALAVLLFTGLAVFPAPPPAQASGSAEWSILWLIVPELDATADGTRHRSTTSTANVNKMKAAAADFKKDVEQAIKERNGLDLNLIMTVVESTVPLRRFSGDPPNSYGPTQDDLGEILDKYAPNRERDYDSLIVMAEFPGLHDYGGFNSGWYSFCPLPYSASDFLMGYNIQIHEWLHQLDQLANRILQMRGSSEICPTADDLQEGNYIDVYLKAKYPGVTGELFLRKFYFEHLAGTLPVGALHGKTTTTGFQKEYWGARPTLAQPKVEFTFTNSAGAKATREARGITTVGPDAAITLTYGYDVELSEDREFFLDIPGVGFRRIGEADIVFDGARKFSVDLAKINYNTPLVVGQRYNLRSHGNIRSTGQLLDPDFREIPFIVTEGGEAILDGGTVPGTIGLTAGEAPHINLTTETIDLPRGFTVAAHSLDGRRWRKGALPADAARLARLFNRGMTLRVANEWNDKNIRANAGTGQAAVRKGVPDSATVIQFPKIEARPRPNTERIRPFFTEAAWFPLKGGISAPDLSYEWAESGDGRTPSGAWTALAPIQQTEDEFSGGSFPLPGVGQKVTLLFRIAPSAAADKFTPAGRPFRVRPRGLSKAPNLKANEKKGVIKIRKDHFYQIGDAAPVLATAAVDLNIVASATGDRQVQSGSSLTVWRAANGKRPPSARQALTVPNPPPEAS